MSTQCRCVVCDAPYRPHHTGQVACSKSCAQRLPRPSKPCASCAAEFVPLSNRAKFCLECSPRAGGGSGSRPRTRIVCARCGQPAVVTKQSARFCSHACYIADRYPDGRQTPAKVRRTKAIVHLGRWAAAERRLAAAVGGSHGDKALIAGRCGSCGDAFVGTALGLSFCSFKCKRRETRRRRKALKRGATVEFFDSVEIFERDGWRCKLCGKAVARGKVAPHPKAPVLDHVLPLTYGGQHSRANTQCAHFLCNSIKSAGVWGEGEQLRLIG